MKRLIQINSVSNYGSTGKIMEAIGLLAQSEGWISEIAIGGRYSRKSQLRSFLISNVWQNRLSALYSFLTDRHGFSNVPETKRFIDWLKTESPDIIHLHNIHSYYLNVAILFEYLAVSKVPVIWTLHDCWPFTGHCSHFITANCYKWQTGCSHCPQVHCFPKSLILDKSSRNYCDKKLIFCGLNNLQIVTVSQWLGDNVRKSFLGRYPIQVIANGIDVNLFRPSVANLRSKYGLEKKTVLLGVSTAWCTSKGLEDYVELRKVLPDSYSIVLVGMTTKQVRDYSGTGILCFEKTKDTETLVAWYNTADIILNISYAETFGLPVVEGYACGKPAIVYDNTALSELIVPGTGLKSETGNIKELAAAVISLATSRECVSSVFCRERAESLYDRDKNYRQYLDLYNSALDS